MSAEEYSAPVASAGDVDEERVPWPEFIARFARLVSPPARPLFGRTMVLALVTGVLRGLALVALLPAAVALSSGGAAWGLRMPGWLWVLAVLAVVGGVVEYILALVNYRVALDLIRTVLRRIGDRLARLPLGWFSESAAGRLSRLVSQEVLMLGETLAHMLASATASFGSVLAVLAGSWVWDWRLGLVLTIAAPVYGLALWLGRRAITYGKRISEPAEEELSDRIVEFARCQGALRSAGRSDDFAPLTAANAATVRAGRRGLWWSVLANLLHGAVGQLVVVALIVLAAQLAVGGALAPIPAIAFIGLSLRFVQTLEDLGSMVMGIEDRHVMVDHVNEILTAQPLPEPAVSAQPSRPGDIELDRVEFGYLPDRPVLRDVSLSVPAGGMCAIVGPSGSGKTTIARLVARFYDVDAGTVRVGGEDVRDQSTEDLMRQLSMVFQDVYLFDDTLEANIRLGDPEADAEAVRAAGELAGVAEIVDRLPEGWQTRVGEGGHALSGGERQRVSIARALLKHAPIVLLDEATSALDPENEIHVVASMERLRHEATLLVIAHKLDTIRTADQIVVLDGSGRIAQRGTHDELVGVPGQYRDFCLARERAEAWRLA